jgi:CubicO group peptidase (beta-lactamase class C family)
LAGHTGDVRFTDDDMAKVADHLKAISSSFQTIGKIPALAAGVVADGELIATYGHGADEHTLFRIASMTKSFTAATVLHLRDSSLLRLDDPVALHAPEFKALSGPSSDAATITIRHLLTMSSGMSTDDPWADRHLDMTDEDLDTAIALGPTFARATGGARQYSNLGYAVLGRVVRNITGSTVQKLISERFLSPLGMTETVWNLSDAPAGITVAIGMRTNGVTPEPAPGDGVMAPMGGLWSTVHDLAKWVTFFTDAYPARNDADDGLLSRASRREMQTVQTIELPQTIVANDGSSWPYFGGYGMGMFTDFDADLGHICGHSGGVPGYGSNMRWITGSEPGAALHTPTLSGSRIGVIALANTTYAPMIQLTRRVLQSMRAHGLAGPVAKQVPEALTATAQNLFMTVQRLAASSLGSRPLAESPQSGDCVPSADSNDRSHSAGLLQLAESVDGLELFADNVLLDEPLNERVANAAKFFAANGPLRFVRCEVETDADATLVVANEQREFRIGFSLSVSPPNTIQAFKLPS